MQTLEALKGRGERERELNEELARECRVAGSEENKSLCGPLDVGYQSNAAMGVHHGRGVRRACFLLRR